MTPKGSRPVLRGLVGSNAHPATQLIDFLAVLFGYTISGERTLEAFYQTVLPWAEPFMALFNREKLPSRSALSRFLAVFTLEAVEALRALFVEDLLARPLAQEQQRGELLDRAGGQWEVFDIDGTREAARQRALPKTEDLPAAQRRLRRASVRLGIPGASVGKSSVPVPSFRKPTARSRLGSFGNRGNGEYRKELAHALGVIRRYLAALAEFERELIAERTRAGLASARARGRMGGRPYTMTPAKLRLAMAAMGKPETKVGDLCAELGVTRQTLYRHVGPDGMLRPDGEKLLKKKKG